jgi:hypothetical protein
MYFFQFPIFNRFNMAVIRIFEKAAKYASCSAEIITFDFSYISEELHKIYPICI